MNSIIQVVKGDIWDMYNRGCMVVIPINTTIKRSGELVMGAGLAKQAAQKFPSLPKDLGAFLLDDRNDKDVVLYSNGGWFSFYNNGYRNLSFFITKTDWKRPSTRQLLRRGFDYLEIEIMSGCYYNGTICLPPLGTGFGCLPVEVFEEELGRFVRKAECELVKHNVNIVVVYNK